MLQQSHEGVSQHLVRAVADEHLFGLHLVVGGQGSSQRGRLRVRIESQRLGRLAADRFQRAWGRAKWTFIGVELDQFRHARLFARHIGAQVVGQAAPETAHLVSNPASRLSHRKRGESYIALSHAALGIEAGFCRCYDS
jgi:hypothetical protein